MRLHDIWLRSVAVHVTAWHMAAQQSCTACVGSLSSNKQNDGVLLQCVGQMPVTACSKEVTGNCKAAGGCMALAAHEASFVDRTGFCFFCPVACHLPLTLCSAPFNWM